MWAFIKRHKFGIIGTIFLHVLLLFIATQWYMPIGNTQGEQVLVIDFPEMEEESAPSPFEEEISDAKTPTNDASNRAVNETAPDVKSGEYNQFSEPSKTAYDEQIAEELKALEQSVIDDQRAQGYGYSEEEVANMLSNTADRSLADVAEQKPRSEAAYKGNTNITYKLANRYDVFLKVPVYLCQYGGLVVVNIAVDKRGKVVSAKVDQESSRTTDECLITAAINGAKQTTFNSTTTSGIQKGSITYNFITQ